MSLVSAVELLALGLAVWAALQSIPQPVSLDWERLFKVALSTVLRGEVEAAGGDRQAWEAAVRGRVLYHPAAGPRPEEKLVRPDPGALPVPPLPGERALTGALAALSDPEARFTRMYLADAVADEALFSHPAELGPAYDPALLAAGLDWDALAAGAEPARDALRRRLASVIWVDIGGGLARAAAAGLGARAAEVELPREDEAAAAALLALVPHPADRLVLVAAGEAAPGLLRALLAGPLLRDRLAAVVVVGGALGTDETRAWLAENFQHDRLDPELNRTIPYAVLVEVDPDAPLARPWEHQRLPIPDPSPSGRQAIEVLELGPLALGSLPEAAVARALAVVLAFRLA